MKKFLPNSLTTLTSLIFSFAICSTFFVRADPPIKYYRDAISDWGYETETLKNVEFEDLIKSSGVPETTVSKYRVDQELESEALLLTSAQLEETMNSHLLNYFSTIFVVCNSDYRLGDAAECSYNFARLNLQNDNTGIFNLSSESDVQTIITRVEIDNKNFYLIPELYMVSPEYSSEMGAFFGALDRADSAGDVDAEDSPARAVTILRKQISPTLWESAIYALAILLFVAALKFFIVTLVNDPKKFLDPNFYKNCCGDILSWIKDHQPITSYVIFVMLVLFLPVLPVLSYKDTGNISISYILSYLISSIHPLEILDNVREGNTIKIGVALYFYVLGVLFFILILPSLVSIFALSLKKISKVKPKADFIRYSAAFLLLGTLTAVSVGRVDIIAQLTAVNVLLLILITYWAGKSSVILNKLYSSKEKFVIIALAVLIFGLGNAWRVYRERLPHTYSYENLIGVDDELVLLPYEKSFGADILFDPYKVSGDYPVFINDFGIYHPNYRTIENKAGKDFSDRNPFILIADSEKDYIRGILENRSLERYVLTTEPSKYFTFDGSTLAEDKYELEIRFNCSLNPEAEDVVIRTYVAGDEDSDKNTVLNFPGCEAVQTSVVYKVPFKLESQDYSIYGFEKINFSLIEQIKVFKNGEEHPVKFIKNYQENPVIYEFLSGGETLSVYSFGLDKNRTVKRTGPDFDVSKVLNEMILNKELKSPFVIWSTNDQAVIRNEFLEELEQRN
jgi:hypothetical protein